MIALGPRDDPFEFEPPLYLIVPWPRPAGVAEAIRGAATALPVTAGRRREVAVLVFTDLDLAERFLATDPAGADHKPLALADLQAVFDAVNYLERTPATHLLFDPEPIHAGRSFPLDHVYAVLRQSGMGPQAGGG